MIWLLKPDQTEATEFAPAMDETTVAGKPVQVGFDDGRLTYDADGAHNDQGAPDPFWDVNASLKTAAVSIATTAV